MNWFEVDRAGLTEIAKRRGMAFVITEPIQNAWDESSSLVEVTLEPVPNSPRVDITVRDDSPDGFRDLADSYRLFRESYKLENPEQRGRFNLGEKLLLVMADEARVTSTKGSVIFDRKGRRRGHKHTERGSILTARLRMTRQELEEAVSFASTLIQPAGVRTTINGNALPERQAIATAERSLNTEVRGAEGGFRYLARKTMLALYNPLPGEKSHLYEMGIPIDTIDCPWHVSVGQKVPLSMDRGSVYYGYTQKVEEYAAEIMAERMTKEQARDGWVSIALIGMKDDDAVRSIIKRRFGKAVVYDPSSQEANKRALDAGYHVVRGGELSKGAWESVRRAKALKPSGQVFRVGIRTSPDGVPPEPRESWTEDMERFAIYAEKFSAHVLDHEMTINFYRLQREQALAFCRGTEIGVNLANGGGKMLLRMDRQEIDQLLIHECSHVVATDHLSDAFHTECCRIGAALRDFYEWP